MADTKDYGKERLDEARQAFNDGQTDNAISLAAEAHKYYVNLGDNEGICRALNTIASLYYLNGQTSRAIDFYADALIIARKFNYKFHIVRIASNIGSVFHNLDDYETAFRYFKESEALMFDPEVMANEEGSIDMMRTYFCLTESAIGIGNYEAASDYLAKVSPYVLKLPHDSVYYIAFCIDQAIMDHKKGLINPYDSRLTALTDLVANTNNLTIESQWDNYIMMCHLIEQIKRYDLWEQLLFSMQNMAKKQGNPSITKNMLEHWIKYYKAIGDVQRYSELCISYYELVQDQRKDENHEDSKAFRNQIAVKETTSEQALILNRSTHDQLTGLGNRYKLEEDFRRLSEAFSITNCSFAFGIIDIDNFKAANDILGHLKGDEYLKAVADCVCDCIADYGYAYRYGGDEIVVLLTVNKDELKQLAKRINAAVNLLNLPHPGSTAADIVTVSQGYHLSQVNEPQELKNFIYVADLALYTVKNSGKNNFLIK